MWYSGARGGSPATGWRTTSFDSASRPLVAFVPFPNCPSTV
jgi:hypothetical protein